jgi:hypothetical protein
MGRCSTALAFNNIGGIKNTKRGVEEVLQSYISGMNCAGKTTLSRRGMSVTQMTAHIKYTWSDF